MNGTEKSRTATALIAVVGAFLFLGAASASGAGLLIADGGFGGVLEVVSHEVQVTINNGVAVTEVTQIFRNTEQRQVEALFTFPVPKGASVANFSMWINGKEMIGEVVEKKRAREIYESYKRTRKDPGLLEQTDYKTFEMRIFPINGGAEQRVKIRYYQELDFDNDWVTYVYPLSTVSKAGVDSRVTGKFALSLHAKSRVPIVEMESPSHGEQFVFAKHTDTYHQASLEAAGGDLNRDVVLAYKLTRPKTGLDMICSKDGRDDGYFCLTLTAGKELAAGNGPMDYAFILDISGSMAEQGKLRISRECIQAFLDQLGEKDRFEIITFNVRPDALFGQLQLADEAHRKQAREHLATRKAAGGTVLRPALTTAYKYRDPDRPLNVVILSDGMTEQGERRALMGAIAARPAGVRVFCVGVGNEVNRPLLSQIAEDAGGLASFLSRGDNFSRQAKAFRRKLLKPAMTSVKITFAGGGIYDLEPAKLPNLYHGAPVRMYGRYRKADSATITLEAEINGQPFKQTMPVTFPDRDAGNPEISRMWAWHRIQSLLKESDRVGSRQAMIDQIVRLGELHSIATQYTSFIVLENDAEYRRWRIKRRNAQTIRRDREARGQLLAELERLRDRSMQAIGPRPPRQIAETTDGSPAPSPAPQAAPGPVAQRDNSWDIGPISDSPFGTGGGPVGSVGLGILGVLAAGEVLRRRRRKAK